MSQPEPETDYERLALARGQRFPSATAFAERVGINPTTYRAYESGQNGFAKHAAVFSDALGVSAEWLLTGRERAGERYPVRNLPRLPDTIDKAPDLPRTIDADGGETVAIKTLDLSYAMGAGTSIDDYIEEVDTSFDVSFIRRRTRSEFGRLRLARGVGDSMFPTLLTNDVVLIDTTQNELRAQDGVYAIALYGAAAIKRLRRSGPRTIMVKSDNPAVDDQEVDASDIRIHGRVIWFGRDL